MRACSRGRALAMLGAFSVAGLPAASSAQAATPIRIGVANSDPYMVPVFAQELGSFRAAKLDVALSTMTNGAVIMQAVSGGALDVGLGDILQLTNAVHHGLPLAYFIGGAIYTNKQPTQMLCVPKTSPIRTAKDLEGQTIGCINLKSLSSISIYEWLRKNGADPSKVKLYEINFAEMAPALARGQIPCALVGEPFLSAMKDEVRRLGDTFAAIAPQLYINCWYASRDWIARNTDLARSLQRVFYQTARFVNANRNRGDIVAIEAKFTRVDPALFRESAHNLYATSLDPKLMQPVIDVGLRYSLIDRPVSSTDIIVNL
jgi:NitT/TauT family transport system substrate-binding protein